MSRIKKINNNKSMPIDYNLTVIDNKEYGVNVDDNIDWSTDQDLQMDPSINEYNKGYEMEPYNMRFFANKNVLHQVKKGETFESIAKKYFGHESYSKQVKEMNTTLASRNLTSGMMLVVGRKPERLAGKEISDITYTPENIAKEILTLWSQVDGPLQNFFEGFTANKTSNKMKQEIAEYLKQWGYDVTPVLVDETPRYAAIKTKVLSKIATIAKEENMTKLMSEISRMFPKSKVARALFAEIRDLEQHGTIVKKAEAAGLLDYYKAIYPDDYASALIDVSLDRPNLDDMKDVDISNESLDQMEKMDSENQNPMNGPQDGGMNGYNFTTQMRPDSPGGVPATSYETGPFNVYKANRIFNKVVKNVKKK